MFFNSCKNNNANFTEKPRSKITEFFLQNFSRTKDEKLADKTMKKVKQCIDEKNSDSFKQLFCNNVINTETNLENQIKYMFDLFPSGIVEYTLTGDGGVSDGWEYGCEYYEIMRKIIITDGVYEYAFILNECIKDTSNKEELNNLLVFTSEKNDYYYIYLEKGEKIYYPKQK